LSYDSVRVTRNAFEDFILDTASALELTEQHSAVDTTLSSKATRKRRRSSRDNDSNRQPRALPPQFTTHTILGPRSYIAPSNSHKQGLLDSDLEESRLYVGGSVTNGDGRVTLEEDLHKRSKNNVTALGNSDDCDHIGFLPRPNWLESGRYRRPVAYCLVPLLQRLTQMFCTTPQTTLSKLLNLARFSNNLSSSRRPSQMQVCMTTSTLHLCSTMPQIRMSKWMLGVSI
jgi:hypothetical protein